MSDVVVIGSLNMDLVVKAQRFPAAGETIAGDDFRLIPGGKGANQAVAAARLGAGVSMVGCVGGDPFGDTLRQNLTEQGVDVARVRVDESVSTGTAVIVVDESGENRIVIVAGANGRLSIDDVQAAEPAIKAARAVVLQFEIKLETVEQALKTAQSQGTPVILNPAPAYEVPEAFLHGVDYLVMNETESELLTGIPVANLEAAREAAQAALAKGVGVAIITLGAQGALVAHSPGTEHVPGHQVEVVDTTAAGDAFVGGLAASLAGGDGLHEALRLANAAGALAVTRFGAQTSLPSLQEARALSAQRSAK